MKEAMLYHAMNGDVRCNLCFHRCRIKPGLRGVCLVRQNVNGKLFTRVYGRSVAREVDPVEKKPLFHFLPGTLAYSVATVGCNFHCRFCQNWQIAQAIREDLFTIGEEISPDEIVENALKAGCRSIAYTYTEPTIFFEYAFETARIAKKRGLMNIFVTNGYETEECIDLISPYLDAANVDLKSFRDEFYRKTVGATLNPVLETLRLMKKKGIWIEVTTLLIPFLNDSQSELKELAEFISKDLGAETPWHVSRFFPAYQMVDHPRTPIRTLLRAIDIGYNAGLKYVYAGNLTTDGYANTFCPTCAASLIQRKGFQVVQDRLWDGECPECHSKISGIWDPPRS